MRSTTRQARRPYQTRIPITLSEQTVRHRANIRRTSPSLDLCTRAFLLSERVCPSQDTRTPDWGSRVPSKHLGRDGLCVPPAQTTVVGVFVGRLPPPTSALSSRLAEARVALRL